MQIDIFLVILFRFLVVLGLPTLLDGLVFSCLIYILSQSETSLGIYVGLHVLVKLGSCFVFSVSLAYYLRTSDPLELDWLLREFVVESPKDSAVLPGRKNRVTESEGNANDLFPLRRPR